ncbi:hypothetical protein ABB37_07224 [Leptomonas pyrrhocoris]|uniref:Pyrroline-5-carboxylate reductase catalytic N-terminal domain-containing protein n=1 Tax=Leptomonas pyrrhocoris TaxID=157538 RepID=A0A0M9FWD6_LEPPY|nr:hypothetical protein ABB37_07224 [Leptomonas pyrrhocoris]KPA77343.1 hypothetical protein ABB37_07224 [Leptomonas pyrrhocoris]|eukprot:XP_015655782.1 hypothetical protein ABB37_07224 [Leptomonas pyrrhocoris]
MNPDSALLLQTVLGERGCVDATLQDTAATVPFVYRVLAEQSVYVVYAVSVMKALLHEKDAAFAHLARWQAQRSAPSTTTTTASPPLTRSSRPNSTPTPAEKTLLGVPADLPAVAPSDSLDLFVTIIGGGTCCELLLRLLCENNTDNSSSSGALAHRLVHPSHLSVVTRQPERLARHAQRGVHCLKRRHGRTAVMRSDVVLLTCPPALFREVANDVNTPQSVPAAAAGAMGAERPTEATNTPKASPAPASNDSAASPSSVLQPTAVLVSCMAGVPVRKVAIAFHRTPELTLTMRVAPHDGVLDDADAAAAAAMEEDEENGDGGASAYGCTPPSLQQVARLYQDASGQYKEARIADMRCNISFLRPAVLQQQQLLAKQAARTTSHAARTVRFAGQGVWGAADAPGHGTHNPPRSAVGPSSVLSRLAAPRLTDFTAGHHAATAPSLATFLDLWRRLQSYVRATFAEALQKARSHGHGAKTASSGLISVVLPENAYASPRAAGEVEAELLPALTLLPASKTVLVWEAWWGSGIDGGDRGGSAAASSATDAQRGDDDVDDARTTRSSTLSPQVTAVTGAWLRSVYASDAALMADLELQYQRVLEGPPPCIY